MTTIEEGWDERLRLAASARARTAPPSAVLRRIAAPAVPAPSTRRSGRSAAAGAPPPWPAGSRRPPRAGASCAGLDKGESRHALARAGLLDRLGARRDRAAETLA